MENILYLDEYINLYNKTDNKIIVYKPYKDTLKSGRIINRSKFIKKFNKLIEDHHLNKNFFNKSIYIVINNNSTNEDKKVILETFDELNYKNIKFISEVEYLKLDKNNIYINFNDTYFYIYNINYLGKVETSLFQLNNLTKSLILSIIEYYKNKKIFIFGKNYKELENILKDKNYNYYYFEESQNLILKILSSKNM